MPINYRFLVELPLNCYEKINQIQVVGECDNATDAIGLAARLRPDVVVSDFALPGLNAIELAGRLHREYGGIRTIILSGYVEEEHV